MKEKPTWNEYAENKVKKYLPPCKEKSTLCIIAGHLNYETDTSWPSIKLIAHEAGHSVPTVKRHIKTLEQEGHLIVDRPSRHEHRSSVYRIPCCSLSLEELEFITGIESEQLLLGIVDPETPGTTIIGPAGLRSIAERKLVSNRYPMGINLIPNGYQTDTLTTIEPQGTKEEARLQLERLGVIVKTTAEKQAKLFADRPDLLPYVPGGRIPAEDQDLILARQKARSAIGLSKKER